MRLEGKQRGVKTKQNKKQATREHSIRIEPWSAIVSLTREPDHINSREVCKQR